MRSVFSAVLKAARLCCSDHTMLNASWIPLHFTAAKNLYTEAFLKVREAPYWWFSGVRNEVVKIITFCLYIKRRR